MSEDHRKNLSEDSSPSSPGSPAPESGMSRRGAIGWILGAGSAVIGVLLAIPLVRMAFYPLFANSGANAWTDAGAMSGYDSLQTPARRLIQIETTDGWQRSLSKKVVYVTKAPNGKVRVLSAVRPHLGCEISWNAEKDEFLCPCHGSIFSPDGARIAGPTPRAMDSLPARIANGRLMVRYEYFSNLAPTKEVIS